MRARLFWPPWRIVAGFVFAFRHNVGAVTGAVLLDNPLHATSVQVDIGLVAGAPLLDRVCGSRPAQRGDIIRAMLLDGRH